MRSRLLLLCLLPIPVGATTYFGIDNDLASFSLLSTNILSIESNGTAVTGNVGAANFGIAASATVSGAAHLSGGQTCSSDCSNVAGGFVFNSAQYAASVTAWNNLANSLNALPASNVSIFGATTLTSGVWQTGFIFLSSENLTLDAQGDPNAQFVIRTGSMHMDGSATINFINGAKPENLIVLASNVNLSTGASLSGIIRSTGPLIRSGSSTNDHVTLVGFNVVYSGQLTAPAAVTPEPSAFGLAALGCVTLIGMRRCRRSNSSESKSCA